MNRKDLRDKIANTPMKSVVVTIEEWDTTVTIKELNGKAFLDVSEIGMVDGAINRRLFLELAVVNSAYTEDNELLFDKGDLDMVSNLPSSIYSKLISAVTEVNGITTPKN